jgi:hypothetical protein
VSGSIVLLTKLLPQTVPQKLKPALIIPEVE